MRCVLLVVVMVLAGCAGRAGDIEYGLMPKLPAVRAITYPAGESGEMLRKLVRGDVAERSKAHAFFSGIKDPQQRAALTPHLLAVVDHGGYAGLWTARILVGFDGWDFSLAHGPEFVRLLPDLVRGLDMPNGPSDPQRPTEWAAGLSANVLVSMGSAAEPARRAIERRFLALGTREIEPESGECWTRFWLGGALGQMGEKGARSLAKGLDHPDRIVRETALSMLGSYGDAAMRGVLPRIVEVLWSEREGERMQAAWVICGIGTAEDASPRLVERLWELGSKGQNTGTYGAALGAMHPVTTTRLLAELDAGRAPVGSVGRHGLERIGKPVVPAIIERLTSADARVRGQAADLLNDLRPADIPALVAATHDRDAERAAAAMKILKLRVREAQTIEKESGRWNRSEYALVPYPMQGAGTRQYRARSIERLGDWGALGKPLLAGLRKVAAEDGDPEVRAAALRAAERIEGDRTEYPEMRPE